jgi:hypothetical protein
MDEVPFFGHKLKDFVFTIFQLLNLHGINLNETYWTIQIMTICMVVVLFHMCM